MRSIFSVVICAFVVGCVSTPSAHQEKFEAAPSPIDTNLDTASIEDYIIALPLHAYHEGSAGQFARQVRHARVEKEENRGMGADYLFVGGDGTRPAIGVSLNRRQRLLTIRNYEWEPGWPDTEETMRRVPGGWMRGPRVVVKTAGQTPVE